MKVPAPLEKTSRLMVGYRFPDGSSIEVADTGRRGPYEHKIMRYRITDATGAVIASGEDLELSPLTDDYGSAVADLIAFLSHDAELYEFSPADSCGRRSPDAATDPANGDYILGTVLAEWAAEHTPELDSLRAELEEEE